MTQREQKIVSTLIGSMIGFLVLILLVRSMLLNPLQDLENQKTSLAQSIGKLERETSLMDAYKQSLNDFGLRTFSQAEDKARNLLSARVQKIVYAAGMKLMDRTGKEIKLKSVSGHRRTGLYKEIGWTITASGSLSDARKLLFALSKDPYLHRLSDLTITPSPKDAKTVTLKTHYLSLILLKNLKSKSETVPAPATEPLPLVNLAEDTQLALHDGIADRNVFRPYFKKKPPPPKPTPRPTPKPPTPRPTPPRAPQWSRWQFQGIFGTVGKEDISIHNPQTGKVKWYNPGKDLAGGTIVMIEVREIPLPGNPNRFSPSRLILKKGGSFYAVELGQSLGQMRRLKQKEIPATVEP